MLGHPPPVSITEQHSLMLLSGAFASVQEFQTCSVRMPNRLLLTARNLVETPRTGRCAQIWILMLNRSQFAGHLSGTTSSCMGRDVLGTLLFFTIFRHTNPSHAEHVLARGRGPKPALNEAAAAMGYTDIMSLSTLAWWQAGGGVRDLRQQANMGRTMLSTGWRPPRRQRTRGAPFLGCARRWPLAAHRHAATRPDRLAACRMVYTGPINESELP